MAKAQVHKIAAYIRVSTEEQAINPEGSIRNQEERLRQAVQYKNSNSRFGEIVHVFIDRARSGKDTNRPELQRMLKAVRNKEVTLIMVTELSRLSRSIKDFAEIWDLMRAQDCSFLSLNESFDTTTAAGEMVMYNMANLAQFERRQVVERVTASIVTRASRGLYNGGCVPLGYKLIPDKKGYLAVDEEQARVVREAFKTFLDSGTLNAAAKSLNSRGYRPRRHVEGGGRHKRVGVFTVDTLWTLLRNKAYLGIKTYNVKGEELEAKAVWEPIIDEATFKRVQKILRKNFRRKKPSSWKKMPYLLSGRIRCGTCGETLCGKTATGATKRVPYYEHASAIKRQSGLSKKFFNCQPIRFSAEKAEALVWQKIEELIRKPELAKDLIARARKQFDTAGHVAEVKRIKARISGYSSQIDALTERLSQLPKTVSATPFFNKMEQLEELKRCDEVLLQQAQAKQISDVPMAFQDYQEFLKKLPAIASGMSVETKTKIIEKLVHKIELKPDRVLVHFYVGLSLLQGESFPKGGGSPSFFVSKNPERLKEKSPNQLRALYRGSKRQVSSSNTIDIGDAGTTRTCDLLLRRQLLYPAELRHQLCP